MDKFGDYTSNEANKDKPKYVHITLLIYRTGKPACSRKVPLVICQPDAANGLNGAELLGRRIPSSQVKNCRGLRECRPSAWIVHQAAPSRLGRQGLPLPLQQFPQD